MWEVYQTLSRGGFLMFVNLAVSIAVVAIVCMRVYALWIRYRIGASAFADTIVAAVDQGNYSNALQLASQEVDHPLVAVTKDVLLKADKSDKEIERAYEAAMVREVPRLKRLTHILPQAGNLATLIGLLGTIQGLIQAFSGAQAEDAAARQEVLAKGITIAFYNTFFGLSIAVFSAIAYIVLNTRQSLLVEQLENAANRVRDRLMDRPKVAGPLARAS